MNHTPGQTTLFETTGLDMGLAVTNINAIVIGAQAGVQTAVAQVKAHDVVNAGATAGLFARNINIWSGHQSAVAIIGEYEYTDGCKNLTSVRPVAGVTLTKQDEVGVTGTAAINGDRGHYADQGVNAFWTRDWTSRISTQARMGWQFNDNVGKINEPAGGLSVEYRLTHNLSVILAGDVNGNKDAVASFSFVIGGQGQSGSNLSQIGGTSLTPFSH